MRCYICRPRSTVLIPSMHTMPIVVAIIANTVKCKDARLDSETLRFSMVYNFYILCATPEVQARARHRLSTFTEPLARASIANSTHYMSNISAAAIVTHTTTNLHRPT